MARSRAQPVLRALALLALVAGALLLLLPGGARTQTTPERIAMLAAIEGVIGPATARHMDQVLEKAEDANAEVLILRLNTPGGLVTSMRAIISSILGSSVPVVGYVAPPGAHAASAGTYILYATNIAAMAPGTNIGAATPVQIGGGGLPKDGEKDAKKGNDSEKDNGGETKGDKPGDQSDLKIKSINDAVALIRSLAELRGRNAEWAEKAVREAATLSANQAREMQVIDLVASDVPALLAAIDGRTVTVNNAERTLSTEGLVLEKIEPDFLTEVLSILSNPNVALILMLIGVYGLVFEFANPGSVGPGIVGVISLIFGLYALNQLPLDYAGLGLLVFGIALMVAEAFTPAFGVLGVGGLIAFVIGATFLVDSDVPEFQLSWSVIAGTAVMSGALLSLLLGYAWRIQRRPAEQTGRHLIGLPVEVLDWSGSEGHVWAEGERWLARGEDEFKPGDTVRIAGVEGLQLRVTTSPADDARNGRKSLKDTAPKGQ